MFKTHTMTRSGQYATKADLAAHNPSAQAGTVRFATSRIALACALLCTPTLQAQSLYDSRGVLDENVLSSVLLARQASTELDLRRIAIALIEMGLPVDNQSLRLPVQGDALRHPQVASHGFYRLPGQLNSRRDANGGLVAYCPFDFRGSASVRRLAGSTQHSAPDAVAFAVLSPGNNGHFENTCADIRDLAQGNARTPSQTTTRFADDDVILIYTNREFSASGVTRSNFGYTVNGYDDLPLSKDYVVDGQVRLVKNLNQFFRAQSSGDSFVWQPLTPSAIVTQADKNRADFAWLSGAVSIGETSALSRPNLTGSGFSENSPSVLTLGNQVVDKASAASTGEKASGISFADDNRLLRTYLGQSNSPGGVGQTEFVIRHSTLGGTPLVRDRLRVKQDGQLWLGDVPVSNPSVFATPSNTVLFGSTRIGAGGADSGGSPSLIIGNTLQGQDAILRFYTTSSSNVLELGTTGNTGIASHLLLSPINNVGIGYNPASSGLPAYKLDVNGSGRFMGELTADGGLTVNNGGLTATTGTFSGLLTANNGLTVTNGGLTVTNGGLPVASLAAGGGLTATTGTFSGLLTANAGLTVNTAALNANSGLTATTGTFSGLLTANAGLTVNTAALNANSGLTATTGTFSGLLTANSGLDVRGLTHLYGDLRVDGTAVFNRGITVSGGIRGLNTVALRFYGYLGPGNGNPEPIGNATLDINTGAVDITLRQANEHLYSIDQNLSSAITPTFKGIDLKSGGISSIGVISTQSHFRGYLEGTARDANKLNKTLLLNFLKNAGDEAYATVAFDLREDNETIVRDIIVNSTSILNYGNFYSDNAFNNTDNRSVTTQINNPNITYNITCSINGSSTTTCSVPQNTFTIQAVADSGSFLQGNNYSGQGSNNPVDGPTTNITQYDIINNYTGNAATVSLAESANRLSQPITLQLRGDFFDDANVSFNAGDTQTITLASKGLTRAIAMDQRVNKDSEVEFNQILVHTTGDIKGDLSAGSLQVQGATTVRLLSALDTGRNVTIKLDPEHRSAEIGNVLINGRDGSVTADHFKGNAETATRLAQDITFTFNGVVSGTGSSRDGFNYTISTNLANDSIESVKLASVDGAKLVGRTVTSAKLALEAVTTENLAPEAVTTEKLHPDAVIYAARNLQSTSDMRLKSDISAVNGTSLLQRLSQVLLYGYRFNDDPTQSRKLGVLAQELQPLFPELVGTQTSGPYAGYLFVDYGLLSAVGAAGVGELNRKLDALGLSVRAGGTLQASLPNFVLTDLEGRNAQFKKLQVDELTAKEGKFDKLDAKQFTTERSRSKQLQADTLNSGSTEGYASGAGLQLFSALDDGHYLVQVSASDGSFASASVFVSGGTISVMPIGGNDISITAQMGTVYAVAAGKMLKASWLKTG